MLFDKDTIDQINNSFDPANAAYSSDRYTNEPGHGGRITPMDAANASVMIGKNEQDSVLGELKGEDTSHIRQSELDKVDTMVMYTPYGSGDIQSLISYRDDLPTYNELDFDNYFNLNVCKLFFDMFLTLDNLMVRIGDRLKAEVDKGNYNGDIKKAIETLRTGLLKNNYKNRSFESISNYLKQFEVLINSFENDNDEDALANLDVKATFDLVVEVVKKLKFVVGRDLQEKLTNLKTVDETLDDEEANDFVKSVSGKFVKFYKNFVRMIHEKTKTFSLINLRQLMLDLQKDPDNGPVRAKVTKQIKALIKSFSNLMSDYFYKFPDLFKEGNEENEVNLSSMFEENNDENRVLEIDVTSPTVEMTKKNIWVTVVITLLITLKKKLMKMKIGLFQNQN